MKADWTTSLTVLTFLPLLGAAVIGVLGLAGQTNRNVARTIALVFSIVVLGLALVTFASFSRGTCTSGSVPAELQAPANSSSPFVFTCEESVPFFPLLNSYWHVGVDGLSMAMVLLTALLLPRDPDQLRDP